MSKMILLVEDNPTDEKLAVLALKKCGIPSEIVIARDGADAIEFMFATGKYASRDVRVVPAVVLLDLKLPLVDGHEVLRRIRADPRTQSVPVVVLTSSRQDEDVARSYELRANAYVRKPVDFAEFTEAARTLGDFWLRLNQPAPPPV